MTDFPDSDDNDKTRSREEILNLLSDIQSHYGTYHNHKETSAWAAVVVYVALLVGFINAIIKAASISPLMHEGMTIAILAVGATTLVYLHKQFSLRRVGADYVAACIYLRSEIISKPAEKLNVSKYAPNSDAVSEMQSSYVLPNEVLKKSRDLKEKGQGSRTVLEKCAYVIVVIVTLVSIASTLATFSTDAIDKAKTSSSVAQEAKVCPEDKKPNDSGPPLATMTPTQSQSTDPNFNINVNIGSDAKTFHSKKGPSSKNAVKSGTPKTACHLP